MSDPSKALMLQFLAWVAEAPRTYADAMEGWRSTCPRLSIWEDAILDGLIAFDGGRTRNQSRVTLTVKGRALLRASEPFAPARVGELVRSNQAAGLCGDAPRPSPSSKSDLLASAPPSRGANAIRRMNAEDRNARRQHGRKAP